VTSERPGDVPSAPAAVAQSQKRTRQGPSWPNGPRNPGRCSSVPLGVPSGQKAAAAVTAAATAASASAHIPNSATACRPGLRTTAAQTRLSWRRALPDPGP
jgi:hypothetical protein